MKRQQKKAERRGRRSRRDSRVERWGETNCGSPRGAPYVLPLKQREVRHFGYAIDYELQGVRKDAPLAEPIPEECAPFLVRLVNSGHLGGLSDQLIVTRYLPGQGSSFDPQKVKKVLFKVIQQCEEIDIAIDAVISDMGPDNRAIWRL
ncbi:hypothetical protein HPB47_025668 [Ixodes persulcatus]|uniref:Uncharacterized protein n=1 Tax=Ixodes persulcatus TaxID=34615 RepID=A0AC60Q243_IXOPE|nr:hypothetical protein HPB47_025668 [Ixodes persulcatus]